MARIGEISDERLFIDFSNGDSAAFESLFQRYQHQPCRHIEHMLNDLSAAEDIVVETFLRLHSHRHKYDNRHGVRGWMYTIARNLARNWLRRERLKRWSPLTVIESKHPMETSSTFERQEIRASVAAAFAKLSSRQREVCSLRIFGELSLEEIAVVTKVPLGTVKSRLFYGQRRLRDLLSDLDPNRIKE